MTGVLWVIAYALPAAAAALLGLLSALRVDGAMSRDTVTRLRARVITLSPVTVLPAGVVALVAVPDDVTLAIPDVLLGVHLQLDLVARPLVLVASLLYAAALVAVRAAQTERAPALTAFLLVCFVGNVLVFTAADAATFYLAFALMSFAAYGLVVHERTPAALRAGRVYLVLTVLSELVVLTAVLLVVDAGGLLLADAPAAVAGSEHRGLIVGLLIVGFGVKAGTVPLHVWLPLAHPAAPPPASAVLSGAMVKAGLAGWLRFLPLGEAEMSGWGTALVAVALLGVFAALPLGVLQGDAKVALAYSSISQMGFLAVLVGTALATPDLAAACVVAAIVYAVHHGQAKGALFLGVTVWRTHHRGRVRWWVLIGLVISGLAVAGAPLGSGAVAKYAAKDAVDVASAAVLGVQLVDLLPLVGTVSTLLLLRFGYLLLRGERDEPWGVDGSILSWSALVVVGTALTWVAAARWAPVISVPELDAVTLWDAAWPVLLGLALGGLAWAAHRRGLVPVIGGRKLSQVVPAGDVVVLEERALRALERRRAAAGQALGAVRHRAARATSTAVGVAGRGIARATRSAEDALEGWRVAGAAVLAVAAVLALVLGWVG